MSPGPEVTVVTATSNREERLAALLSALEAQSIGTARFEVVVVDDASQDATGAVLEDVRRRGTLDLHTLRQPRPAGPAAARNRGWREGRAPLVAFTDDDCVPAADWLEALLRAWAGREGRIVQGRTEPDPRERDRLGPYTRTMSVEGPTPHYETCNILYPRAVLEGLGGFDERYPAPAGEDSDLGWRAIDDGAHAVFAPDALVYHAVHELGAAATLRRALLATDDVQAYKRNPRARRLLVQRVFYRRSHYLLLEALYAAWLSRRVPAAALLCLPYVAHLHSRARLAHGSARTMPFLAAYDAVEVVATARGAVRHRITVI